MNAAPQSSVELEFIIGVVVILHHMKGETPLEIIRKLNYFFFFVFLCRRICLNLRRISISVSGLTP